MGSRNIAHLKSGAIGYCAPNRGHRGRIVTLDESDGEAKLKTGFLLDRAPSRAIYSVNTTKKEESEKGKAT